MTTYEATTERPPAWLSRALFSGFIATVAMMVALLIAYGLAYLLSGQSPAGADSASRAEMARSACEFFLSVIAGRLAVSDPSTTHPPISRTICGNRSVQAQLGSKRQSVTDTRSASIGEIVNFGVNEGAACHRWQ